MSFRPIPVESGDAPQPKQTEPSGIKTASGSMAEKGFNDDYNHACHKIDTASSHLTPVSFIVDGTKDNIHTVSNVLGDLF